MQALLSGLPCFPPRGLIRSPCQEAKRYGLLSRARNGLIVAPMQPVVAYHRVSTARQGRSGLGLEAQAARCALFAAQNGMAVVEAFTEV